MMDDRRSEDKEDKDPSLFRGHSIQLGFDKFHVNLTYSCSDLDPFALERESARVSSNLEEILLM